MKRLIVILAVAFAAVAMKGEVTMDQAKKEAAAVKTYRHVMTPERRKAIEARREAFRAKLAAMTPEERAAYRAERLKRREEAQKKYKNSPRRVVKRSIAEDGTITLERADGSVEVHKIVEEGKADK